MFCFRTAGVAPAAFALSAIALAAITLSAAPSAAHHPTGGAGAGSAGPINVYGAATLPQGQIVAGIVVESISLDALSDATLIHAAEHHIHAHSLDRILAPSLSLAYGLTNDVTVSLRLPYVIRRDIREGHHHHHEDGDVENEVHARGDSAGIGDLTLMGQWRFMNNRASGTELALLAGLKLPTGRTGERDDHGERFEAEFQPGSGSWDVSLGAALSQRLTGPLSLHASALYTIVTDGTQATDLGDRFNYGVALAYRLTGPGGKAAGPMYAGGPKGHRHGPGAQPHHHQETPAAPTLAVDLLLELNGEWAAKQDVAGITDANSGGHTLYLSPGIRMSYDRVSAFASVGIPVVNDMNGLQAEPDWRLVTGLAVAF